MGAGKKGGRGRGKSKRKRGKPRKAGFEEAQREFRGRSGGKAEEAPRSSGGKAGEAPRSSGECALEESRGRSGGGSSSNTAAKPKQQPLRRTHALGGNMGASGSKAGVKFSPTFLDVFRSASELKVSRHDLGMIWA